MKKNEWATEQRSCKNPVRLLMYDGPMKIIKYMWLNIWFMLDWIVGFCHKTAKMHLICIQYIN